METKERIPLLAKLMISFECDDCGNIYMLGWFYNGIEKLVNHMTQNGQLLCPRCKAKPTKDEKSLSKGKED